MKFCVAEHLRRGDATRAESLTWQRFVRQQGVMLYRKLLPHVVNAGTRGAQYGAALEIVKAIPELRAARGQEAVFEQELVELRKEWKAKRNFMKLPAAFDSQV